MTKDKALKMAISELLDVLKSCDNEQVHFDGDDFHETLEACRKALEHPTHMVTIPLDKLEDMQRKLKEQPTKEEILGKVFDAVYSQYPKKQWQGLSEDEFIYFCHWVDAATLSDIEANLKEKNT